MNTKIKKTAKDYQSLDRQIKDLQAKQKPLKADLIAYAKENKSEFDDAFQLKFPNGTYISQRVKDVLEGKKEAKAELLEADNEFAKIDLNEAEVIKQFPTNNRLKKLLKKLNLKVSQKETLAVYAG